MWNTADLVNNKFENDPTKNLSGFDAKRKIWLKAIPIRSNHDQTKQAVDWFQSTYHILFFTYKEVVILIKYFSNY